MNELIIAITVIAFIAYGYWLMDRLDRYLYHGNDRRRTFANLEHCCKKAAGLNKEHIRSLRQMLYVLWTNRIAHSDNTAIQKRHLSSMWVRRVILYFLNSAGNDTALSLFRHNWRVGHM